MALPGPAGSRSAIPAVFSGHSRRAGLAGFAWRPGCSRRAGIALVPFGTLEASPERDRGYAQDDQRWKPAAVAEMFHLIVVLACRLTGVDNIAGHDDTDLAPGGRLTIGPCVGFLSPERLLDLRRAKPRGGGDRCAPGLLFAICPDRK